MKQGIRIPILPVLLILLMFLLLPACSDDSVTPGPDPDILLTVDLNVFFMQAFADHGTVFASGPDGKVLDVATWDGPGTIVLKNTRVHPGTISFTFVQSNDWELELATEVGVPAGSFWTYTGTLFPETPGDAEVEFSNVPSHMGYRFSSYWSSVDGPGRLPPRRSFEVYGDSTDCFVKVDPLDGPPIGGWLRGVHPGETRVFDFNAPDLVSPLTPSPVQLAGNGDRLMYNIYGTVPADTFRYYLSLDGKTINDILPRSITVYTPDIDPANLHAMFYQYIDGNPGTFYSQESTGPVPAEFALMEGDITVTSTSPDSLAFKTNADWDRFSVYWAQQQDLYGHWHVEGRAPIREFALPELPAELVDQYPDYPVEGFDLRMLTVYQDEVDGVSRSLGKQFPGDGALRTDRYMPAPTSLFHRRPSGRSP